MQRYTYSEKAPKQTQLLQQGRFSKECPLCGLKIDQWPHYFSAILLRTYFHVWSPERANLSTNIGMKHK